MGSRIKLRYTRAIIDAIHSGELKTAPTTATPMFNLAVRPAPWLPDSGAEWRADLECEQALWSRRCRPSAAACRTASLRPALNPKP